MGEFLNFIKSEKKQIRALILGIIFLAIGLTFFILYFFIQGDINSCFSSELQCGYYQRYCCKIQNYKSCGDSNCRIRKPKQMGRSVGWIVFSCIFLIIGLLIAVPQWRRFLAYKRGLYQPTQNKPQQGTDVLYSSLLDNK